MTTLVYIYMHQLQNTPTPTDTHMQTHMHAPTHTDTHTCVYTHTHATCTNLSRVERAFIRQHVTEEAVLTDTDVHVDEDAGEELTQEHRGRQAHSTLVQPAARSSN